MACEGPEKDPERLQLWMGHLAGCIVLFFLNNIPMARVPTQSQALCEEEL